MALAKRRRLSLWRMYQPWLFLLSIIAISMVPACASDAPDPIIVTHPGNFTLEELEQKSKDVVYEPVSFDELPLWVKVAYWSGTIGTILGSIFIAPMIIRKVKKSFTSRNKDSIADYIANNPGCITPQIIKDKNISKGTVRYHLKKLKAEGKIILKKVGKFVRLFVSSSGICDKEKLVASYTSNDKDRLFLSTIFNSAGMTNKELSWKFNMNRSTTYWYLKKFIDANIVELRQEGRLKKYYICPDVRHIMVKYVNGL